MTIRSISTETATLKNNLFATYTETMKLANLLALTVISTVIATNTASAQEKTKSVGPVIEFGGGGTAFGIQSKITVSPQFSVRPIVLFGYKPSTGRDNVTQSLINDRVSAGIPLALAVEFSKSAEGQAQIDAVSRTIGTGTAFGLAATYDFKSPDSKIVGYVGPRILFGSASGSGNIGAVPFTVDTKELNIGLTAGADYAVSDNFTAGLNATYNFSRNGTSTLTTPAGSADIPISGGGFNFAINVGYNF